MRRPARRAVFMRARQAGAPACSTLDQSSLAGLGLVEAAPLSRHFVPGYVHGPLRGRRAGAAGRARSAGAGLVRCLRGGAPALCGVREAVTPELSGAREAAALALLSACGASRPVLSSGLGGREPVLSSGLGVSEPVLSSGLGVREPAMRRCRVAAVPVSSVACGVGGAGVPEGRPGSCSVPERCPGLHSVPQGRSEPGPACNAGTRGAVTRQESQRDD